MVANRCFFNSRWLLCMQYNGAHWVRVTNLTDSGGWYADRSDKEFYSVNCGRPKDYVITNSAPRAVFRADNMILDFKDLSMREIEPPHYLSP